MYVIRAEEIFLLTTKTANALGKNDDIYLVLTEQCPKSLIMESSRNTKQPLRYIG